MPQFPFSVDRIRFAVLEPRFPKWLSVFPGEGGYANQLQKSPRKLFEAALTFIDSAQIQCREPSFKCRSKIRRPSAARKMKPVQVLFAVRILLLRKACGLEILMLT